MWITTHTSFQSFLPPSLSSIPIRSQFYFFFSSLQPATSLRDSGTGVFLWILRNLYEYLFCRAPENDYFWQWIDKLFKVNKKDSRTTPIATKVAGFRPIKKEPILLFSHEFCKLFKNTFLTEHFRETVSVCSSLFRGSKLGHQW